MISPLAHIDPSAKIGKNVTVAPFAIIEAGVEIGDDCVIASHASILKGTRIGKKTKVHEGCVIGTEPQDFHYMGEESSVIIGDESDIRENAVIARGLSKDTATVIGSDTYLMEGVHVCHDAQIKDHCIIGLKTIIGASAKVDSYSILSNAVILQQEVKVGLWTLIQSGSQVNKDVPPYVMVSGNPGKYNGVSEFILENNQVQKFSKEAIHHIKTAYAAFYKTNVSVQDAIRRIQMEMELTPEIKEIIQFAKNSDKMVR